jgi:membrane protein
VRSFALVVAIGFLLLVSLAVSAALAALNTWLNRSLPEMPSRCGA